MAFEIDVEQFRHTPKGKELPGSTPVFSFRVLPSERKLMDRAALLMGYESTSGFVRRVLFPVCEKIMKEQKK